MGRRRTQEEVKENNVATVYLGEDYREVLNEVVDELELTRSEYLKALVLQDLVRRGKLAAVEVRRVHRYLLEL